MNFVKVQWTSAINTLWLIYNGEFVEVNANEQTIVMKDDSKAFTNHCFELNQVDTFYIFSNGFADKLSPADKKLMKKKSKIYSSSFKLKTCKNSMII